MFVKVHEQIFNSSIMEEDLEVRYIWFCLLTLADCEGFIDMTIAAISRRINLGEPAVNNAIDKFMQPDPSSRTATQEGRRLEKIRESFGWKIVNYIYYRNLRSEETRRDYMRNYMKGRRDVNKKVNTNVNCKQTVAVLAHAEADTEADTDALKRVVQKFDHIWEKYPSRIGKKSALRHYKSSVKTEKDCLDIHKALENYLSSERVKRGILQNGATWFNNWRDWIDYHEPETQDPYEQVKKDLERRIDNV